VTAAWPEDMSAYPARDDLASQCKLMAKSFDLNIWLKTTVKSTVQDKTTKEWTVMLNTPKGHMTIHAKHLVQATGIGSRVPYVPVLKNKVDEFQGVSMHSEAFKNGALLKKQGINVCLFISIRKTNIPR
jgi:cation diffusion facilitator CzcD-associated flavoprotein CzcO